MKFILGTLWFMRLRDFKWQSTFFFLPVTFERKFFSKANFDKGLLFEKGFRRRNRALQWLYQQRGGFNFQPCSRNSMEIYVKLLSPFLHKNFVKLTHLLLTCTACYFTKYFSSECKFLVFPHCEARKGNVLKKKKRDCIMAIFTLRGSFSRKQFLLLTHNYLP